MNWLASILRMIADAIAPTTDFELPSPGYWLRPEAIDRIAIVPGDLNVLLNEPPKVWRTTVANTNSMDTFLDYRHTVVLIAGANEIDHQRILDWVIPGDIVVYKVSGKVIIHAVKSITIDAKLGRTWKTHGLNPLITWDDPDILTDSNIKWVAILVAYTDRK